MKKNIDKLFRDKMSKSKITAPTESWPIIEAKLKRKKIFDSVICLVF